LIAYCNEQPESDMGHVDRESVFRADTERYSYLMKMCPERLEFDFEIYSYRRDWLDHHMKQAERGIRFITSNYTEKFRIPDGDNIRIFTGGGETRDRIARYIGDYHVELVSDFGSSA